jgi:hypothetical protein
VITKKGLLSPQDVSALLACKRLPGRLTTAETAVLLGFQEHDISPLVRSKLLSPLGKPALNSPKYFAAVEVQALAMDRNWLDKATKVLSQHWFRKNACKSKQEIRFLDDERVTTSGANGENLRDNGVLG